jgi:hypothetical protein
MAHHETNQDGTIQVSARVPLDVEQGLRAVAEKEDRSFSSVIRRALMRELHRCEEPA